MAAPSEKAKNKSLLYRVVVVSSPVIILLFGIFSYTNVDVRKCNMTYMWETPKFVTLKMDKNVTMQYPNYRLLYYTEGNRDTSKTVKNREFSGIPVLFVHGHGGSYKQVRSLASVALRMTLSRKTYYHFDYFSIDYFMDVNGLYGAVLYDQTMFIHECIKHILTLYAKSPNRPESVLVIGHSVGGVAARGIYMLSDYKPGLVHTVITLGTPNQAPVLMLDSYMDEFYSSVNDLWRYNSSSRALDNVFGVSIGGGERDVMVKAHLTPLTGLLPDDRQISTITTAVPKVWLSVDHQCLVWCNQLVLAITRALFDLVDQNTKQLTRDMSTRRDVLNHHLVQNHGPKTFFARHPEQADKIHELVTEWVNIDQQYWTYSAVPLSVKAYVFQKPLESSLDRLIITTDSDSRNWLFACRTYKDSTCTDRVSLDHLSQAIPPTHSNRKMVNIDLAEYTDYTNIYMIIRSNEKPVSVNVSFYSSAHTHMKVSVPGLITFGTEQIWLDTDRLGSMYYNLTLDGITSVRQGYLLNFETSLCKDDTGVIQIHNPWMMEDKSVNTSEGWTYLSINKGLPAPDDQSVSIALYADPTCLYKISVRFSYIKMFGQWFQSTVYAMPSMIAVYIIAVVGSQFKEWSKTGICPKFTDIASPAHGTLSILPVAMLLTSNMITDLWTTYELLPRTDSHILQSMGLLISPLPYILASMCIHQTMVAFSTIADYVFGFCGWAGFVVLGKPKTFGESQDVGAFSAWYIGVLAVVIGLTLQCCGALGIFVSLGLLQYLLVKANFEACIEEGIINQSKSVVKRSYANFLHSVFLLFSLLQVINIASVTVWLFNIWSSVKLRSDPSLLPGVLSATALVVMTIRKADKPTVPSYIGWMLIAVAVVSAQFVWVHLYRASYAVAGALLILSLPQLS